MNHLKIFTSTAGVSLALLALVAIPASGTVLTNGSATLKTGSTFTAGAEEPLTMHGPIGEIECVNSHFGAKTTNESGATISSNIEALSWTSCNALMAVLKKGTLSFTATGSNQATVTSSGIEFTREFGGFHCVFSTNGTKLGTLTGGTPATLDLEATIPRTGGTSGIFCGSTNLWTGAYEFTSPSTLNID